MRRSIVCERCYPVGGWGRRNARPNAPLGGRRGRCTRGARRCVCSRCGRCLSRGRAVRAVRDVVFFFRGARRQPTTDNRLSALCNRVRRGHQPAHRKTFFPFIYRAEPIGISPPEPAYPKVLQKDSLCFNDLCESVTKSLQFFPRCGVIESVNRANSPPRRKCYKGG